jgi:Bacterial TSP3 repeat
MTEITKHRITRNNMAACCFGIFAVTCALFSSTSGVFAGPPVVSQIIEATLPVYDQTGKILQGNEPGREELGLHYIRGCRVEVLASDNGTIYPPLKDGRADSRNPVLHVTYIGSGVDPMVLFPGRFATMVTPRPANGAKIFVRVFNAPSLEISSFYSDSQLFTVSWTTDSIFYADIPHTANALDTDDTDGDGLNNSWETWYGSNPGIADNDNDGFNDLQEFLAGTDADDLNSYLQIVGMTVNSNKQVILQYMGGKDRPVLYQQATDLASAYSQCSTNSGATNCPQGFMNVELPTVTNSNIQVFRLGVPIDEL